MTGGARGSHPLRAAFVMEQVLGHVTHYHTLRRCLAEMPEVEPRWVEVTYRRDGWWDRLRIVPSPIRSTLRGFWQVREGTGGRPPDALFFHTQKPAVFQWDRLARIPTVLSLDVTPVQYDELGEFYDHAPDGHTPVASFKRWLNTRTFGLAERIVVWSTWVKDSLIADYGVSESAIRVIPPGVDLTLWQPRTGANGARAAVPGELPRVLFVGGDFRRKGGHLLLDWYRAEGRGRCELHLVTRDPVPSESGVHVHHGIVGDSAEARALFQAADVFVLPSLGECFGIASVEAMAAGLPVVATRVGGSGDIVEDGMTGFLIPPNDPAALGTALNRLVVSEALRREMGRRGRARAEERFDAKANARAIVQAMMEAAAEGRLRREQRTLLPRMSATAGHAAGGGE